MTDILALGEAMVEFVRLPDPIDGRPAYRQGFGGDTSNTIIAAARQGASTGYLSAVGGDPFGQELLDLWAREGVSTDTVHTRPQDPTGVYFVQPHASGRSFSYARRGSAASLYGPDDLPADVIHAAKILHVSALSQAISPSMRAAVRRACEIARDAGTLVSYDTNLRLNLWTLEEARTAIFDLLPLADIVLPSDDEAETLLGTSDATETLDRFGAHGPRAVVLKRGAEGPILRASGTDQSVPVPQVKAVDSTGAGDSFAGAWLAYYVETGDPLHATRQAVKVAAGTVSGYGAVDPIPRRAALAD
ncbi:MAG: sugar kinase [Pseudomonadota bacterium]